MRSPIVLLSMTSFYLVATTIGVSAQETYLAATGKKVSPHDVFQDCDVCPEMIVLPLGDFIMGGPPGESRLNIHWESGNVRRVTPDDPYVAKHEGPLHRAEIDIPIAMGRNEVTYDQWMACINDGGCGGHMPQDYVLVPGSPPAKVVGNHPVIVSDVRQMISNALRATRVSILICARLSVRGAQQLNV